MRNTPQRAGLLAIAMMDQDFPPTPRQWRATAVALGVCGVVGILLFGGLIPGLHPNYTPSPYTSLDGRSYYWTTASVPVPWFAQLRTPPVESQLHEVTFWTWVTNWSLFGGTFYHGNATEPNGTVYSFVLGGLTSDANWTEVYVSPTGAVAVEWSGGLTAYLLVLT